MLQPTYIRRRWTGGYIYIYSWWQRTVGAREHTHTTWIHRTCAHTTHTHTQCMAVTVAHNEWLLCAKHSVTLNRVRGVIMWTLGFTTHTYSTTTNSPVNMSPGGHPKDVLTALWACTLSVAASQRQFQTGELWRHMCVSYDLCIFAVRSHLQLLPECPFVTCGLHDGYSVWLCVSVQHCSSWSKHRNDVFVSLQLAKGG